ncbi:MAG: GNAT family N-acetyltransferase, partial [Acidimicrobiales bacterium]
RFIMGALHRHRWHGHLCLPGPVSPLRDGGLQQVSQAMLTEREAIRSGRTWVWTRAGPIVAYFTLAGHVIERQDLPHGIGRGSPDRIPAVLIARLALHRDLRGRGLGGVLLADASRRIVDATDIVAARLVVVDAMNGDEASFYTHYGYRPMPGTRRFVRKISDLANDLRSD